jgi:sugar/nucleoside kinase (ribokinase family)
LYPLAVRFGSLRGVSAAWFRDRGGDDVTRIVVVGDLMTDTVARAALPLAKGSDTPAAVTTCGGGSGANIAAWLAVDGAEVAFVGRRGADIAGRNRDMELMGYGVDARLVMDPERPTGNCVVMITHKGDNTMLSDPGANAALSPDDLPKDLFAPGTHLHMSGYTLLNEGSRPAAITAMNYARQADMTISVGGASVAPLERVGAEPYLELTNGATLLFVNEAQAAVLTGRDDPAQAARVLTAWYPHVVVKLGADGALFANGRPEGVRAPAQVVEHFVDGTGSGDAFCAGFLIPWLDKKPPLEALSGGCRLAARARSLVGARPAL